MGEELQLCQTSQQGKGCASKRLWAAAVWVGVSEATSATKWFGLGRAEGGPWVAPLLCPGLSTPRCPRREPSPASTCQPGALLRPGAVRVPQGSHSQHIPVHIPAQHRAVPFPGCPKPLRAPPGCSSAAGAGQTPGLLPAPGPSPAAAGTRETEPKGRKNSKEAGSSRHS